MNIALATVQINYSELLNNQIANIFFFFNKMLNQISTRARCLI